MSSRSRRSSRSSTDRNLTTNGRKRKLTSSQTSHDQASTSQSKSKSKKRIKEPEFPPSAKRPRLSSAQSSDSCNQPGPSGVRKYFPSVPVKPSLSDSEEEEEDKRPVYLNGAMATQNSTGCLNNTTTSFRVHKAAGGAGPNNHAKKTGGGKKLVIKNRKSESLLYNYILLIPSMIKLISRFHCSVTSYMYVYISIAAKAELPENYSKLAWEKLSQAIAAIHTQQPISYSLEELYQAVENMCSHKMAAILYDNLRGECHKHVESLVSIFKQYPAI